MKMTPGERYGRLVTVRPDAVFKKQYICRATAARRNQYGYLLCEAG